MVQGTLLCMNLGTLLDGFSLNQLLVEKPNVFAVKPGNTTWYPFWHVIAFTLHMSTRSAMKLFFSVTWEHS